MTDAAAPILIVGASSGIGCEVVRQVAERGTTVLAHYNAGGARLLALQTEVPGQIVPIQADLSTESGVASLVAAIQTYERVPDRAVFLAAPPLALTRFKELRWDAFQRQLNVQLRATVELLQWLLPEMARARRGSVVFVLSSYTLEPPPSAMAHYVTGKYAALGLMRALAAEYASKHIRLNAVSPSMVETSFLAHIPEKLVELTAQQHPLKRNATPGDVAPIVHFLLSEAAAFVTGVNFPITGGA